LLDGINDIGSGVNRTDTKVKQSAERKGGVNESRNGSVPQKEMTKKLPNIP